MQSRGNLAQQIAGLKVDVHIHNGKVTSTQVTTPHGGVSHQMAD